MSNIDRHWIDRGRDPSTVDDTLASAEDRPRKSEAYLRVVDTVGSAVVSKAVAMRRPLVVGINGVDSSGKTEFSRSLSDSLAAQGLPHALVHIDDFMLPKATRRKGTSGADNYYNHTLDFQALRSQILEPVRAGAVPLTRTLQHPHPRTDDVQLVHTHHVPESPSALIVEGLFLFRPELADMFDARVYLDTPRDEVLRRVQERDVSWGGPDVAQRYIERYIPAHNTYEAIAGPALNAHVVVDTSSIDQPVIVRASDFEG
jgi:uridine kinase